ncbi:MAG TPA: FHA domain-containing protein [Longimicrobiaceae bacterium]|nr:FHA domain-containing protein [Longimicrobiaceae bacterium]
MSTSLQGGRPDALARFVFQGGPRYGQDLVVPSPVVTVGRGAQCDLVLPDDSVSVVHARLEYDAGGWRLTDLESTNGTTAEGVRLAPNIPTPVHAGMVVRFGGVPLLFREMEDVDLDQARAEYVPAAVPTTLKEERKGFRLPLWLLLVIVAVLVIVGMLLLRQGVTAQPAAPATQVSAPAQAPAPARAGP